MASLHSLADELTDLYHTAGYPLVSVIVPPQKITDGKVVLHAIEGKIGTITLNNTSLVHDKTLQGYINHAITEGQPLNQSQSEHALSLINNLAGVDNVSYQLAQGQHTATSDLVIDVKPQNRLQGSLVADNYGSTSTGVHRMRANLSINSPLGLGERLSLEGMTSLKGVNYAKVGLSLAAGVQGTQLSANLSRTQYELGGSFKDLKATGNANTLNMAVSHPLIRQNRHNLSLESSA